MRPLLGLLAYASIAGDHRKALPGAAAVELGHNFSLVHDDIEDGDTERRHRTTLWALRGIPQAINAGDMLFTLSRVALHRLTELGFSDAKVLRLMRLYDDTCVALCEGQYLDIWASERSEPMSVEIYFDMIGRKTAALIAASVETGALLATDDESVITRYRAFGWALGIAFQLNDDLLGIWGEQAATGKEPTDVARHKMTLPDRTVGRPGLHPRSGSPAPRPRPRRAGSRWRGRCGGARVAARDHRRRDQSLGPGIDRGRSSRRLSLSLVTAGSMADRKHLADPVAVGRLDRQRQRLRLELDLVARLRHAADAVIDKPADRVVFL